MIRICVRVFVCSCVRVYHSEVYVCVCASACTAPESTNAASTAGNQGNSTLQGGPAHADLATHTHREREREKERERESHTRTHSLPSHTRVRAQAYRRSCSALDWLACVAAGRCARRHPALSRWQSHCCPAATPQTRVLPPGAPLRQRTARHQRWTGRRGTCSRFLSFILFYIILFFRITSSV